MELDQSGLNDNGEDVSISGEDFNKETPYKVKERADAPTKRKRPRTKDIKNRAKFTIETEIFLRKKRFVQSFYTTADGSSIAPLHQVLIELGLNDIFGVSRASLLKMTSPYFEIYSDAHEGLMIKTSFRKINRDAATVFLDNLPDQCTLWHLYQLGSFYGRVISIRSLYPNGKTRLFLTEFGLLNEVNCIERFGFLSGDSAYMQFVNPKCAENFCKAFAKNMDISRAKKLFESIKASSCATDSNIDSKDELCQESHRKRKNIDEPEMKAKIRRLDNGFGTQECHSEYSNEAHNAKENFVDVREDFNDRAIEQSEQVGSDENASQVDMDVEPSCSQYNGAHLKKGRSNVKRRHNRHLRRLMEDRFDGLQVLQMTNYRELKQLYFTIRKHNITQFKENLEKCCQNLLPFAFSKAKLRRRAKVMEKLAFYRESFSVLRSPRIEPK